MAVPLMKVVVDEVEVELLMRTEVKPALGLVAGPEVVRAAQRRAPVLTGQLRDSIGWHLTPDGVTDVVAVFYDLYLELPAKQIRTRRATLEDALGDLPPVL